MTNKFSFVIRSSEQRKKEKRYWWLVAVAVAAVFGCMFYVMGSPFVWRTVGSKAWDHIKQEHPEVLHRINLTEEDFFNGQWHVSISCAAIDTDDGISFDMIYDKKGNLVACGYESWYLKGGNSYSYMDILYQESVGDLTEGSYKQENYMSFYAELKDYYTWSTVKHPRPFASEYGRAMRIDYKGPYLDPEKDITDDDIQRIARTDGNVSCYFYVHSGDKNDYIEKTVYALEKLKANGFYFSEFSAFAETENTASSFVRYEFGRPLTYDELYGENRAEIIEKNTVLVTYRADGEVIKQ